MNKIKNLLKYFFTLYIHSNKIVAPLVTWIVFLYFSYTIFPINMISSTVTSGVFLFFIMNWIGFVYSDMESPVAEQIIYLRMNQGTVYYVAKLIFLLLIGVVFSFIGVLVPQLQNVTHGFQIFTREINIYDVCMSLLLHIASASVGALTSGLFQSRIIPDRKLASLLILFVSVLAVLKGEIVKQLSILKGIFWLLPPMNYMAERMTNKIYFERKDMVSFLVVSFIFCICAFILQIYILKKRKF